LSPPNYRENPRPCARDSTRRTLRTWSPRLPRCDRRLCSAARSGISRTSISRTPNCLSLELGTYRMWNRNLYQVPDARL
jgi:hypothetical protein